MTSNHHADPTNPISTPEAWQATRAQTALATQVMPREEDEPAADGSRDIGRAVGTNERELFVSCAPAEALQQQFEHLHPEFIAVHDVGTTSSKRLLSGIAAAAGRTLQKLSIRRQGYGTVLARVDFVELSTTDGAVLRLYSTDVEAEGGAGPGIAKVLLGYSRLGVVMVGDLPLARLEAALKPLQDAMVAGPWPNRHLMLLPLAGGNAVATQGASLAAGTHVSVRTTPQVTRPADAWNFINASWARVKADSPPVTPAPRTRRFPAVAPDAPRPRATLDNAFAETSVMEPPSAAPSPAPLAMRPMPQIVRNRAPAAAESLLQRYAQQVSELAGMVSVCIFETGTGRDVAHAGASPGPVELAQHGAELIASITGSVRALGLGHALPDAAVTIGAHHLVIRPVPKHPGLAMHAVLDKTTANLTLARLQIQRIDGMFDGTPVTTTTA